MGTEKTRGRWSSSPRFELGPSALVQHTKAEGRRAGVSKLHALFQAKNSPGICTMHVTQESNLDLLGELEVPLLPPLGFPIRHFIL